MPHLPEEVIQTIINNLNSNQDRNSISLVNKLWYNLERHTRQTIHVSNSDAISPTRLITRFPNIRTLTIKGKPKVSGVIGHDWGGGGSGSVDFWVRMLAKECCGLEKLGLKRMVVTDGNLEMVATCLRKFKALSLRSCSGFTIVGLGHIASNCENLEELELENNDVKDINGQFLNSFPETLSSLVTLNVSCVKGNLDPHDLERLVARSPNLTTLTVNQTLSTDTIRRMILKAPKLKHLGIGADLPNVEIQHYLHLLLALKKCESIESLTLSYIIPLMLLRAVCPICPNLVYLDMSPVVASDKSERINFIRNCPKLRTLLVRDCIEDEGLEIVSNNCKDLENLKVSRGRGNIGVTEVGLIAISTGCQKLKKVTYFCRRMTNAALVTFAKNCQNVTSFKLTMSTPKQPDYTTLQALDGGFEEIVKSCTNLRKLTLSGLLTDEVFLYIAMYAENLELLSVSNAGESDAGMHYVFNGCKNLRKVEISNCPFGDNMFCSSIFKCESMRSLRMDSCNTTFGGCKRIAEKNPSLRVEIINNSNVGMKDEPDEEMKVEKLYLFQTLDGPRGGVVILQAT